MCFTISMYEIEPKALNYCGFWCFTFESSDQRNAKEHKSEFKKDDFVNRDCT